MKYYKDPSGNIYAFVADGSQDAYIPSGLTAITEEEAKTLLAPSAAQLAAAQKAEVQAQLDALDAASARPLRAILAAQQAGGTANASDVAKLAELETQAVELRAKLAGLGA